MKKQKAVQEHNLFDLLSDEIILIILDFLNENPVDTKSFALVCKSFYVVESRHRKTLKPLRSKHLHTILNRYPYVSHLDLTLCPRVTDTSLKVVANAYKTTLTSVDLSASRFFSHVGLSCLVLNCSSLVEIDLSNATELGDSAAAEIAKAKNLERLSLARCKLITDIGICIIAVSCRKLRFINLKWCLGIGDFGVGSIAVKCKETRYLDLSYLPVTNRCLQPILKLQHLEELILHGCFGIDVDGLAVLNQQCGSLKKLDVSSCQNISHTGLSSLTSGTKCLKELSLAYGPPVTLELANSLRKLSMLQTIKLDGCLVTFSGFEAIGNRCISLKELSLCKCLGVTDEGLSSLVSKHRDLRKLDITCCRKITFVSIDHITNSCTSLISLRMESCVSVPREAFTLIGQRCHSLEELDLTDNEIDDEGLKSISRCSKLSSLKLGICLNITNEGLTYVGMSCSKLVELDLYRSAGVTDSGISAITNGCPILQMINLSYCNDITDSSLISLAKCSNINTFEVRGCPLITSVGLAAIAVGCRKLVKLDIKKCNSINDVAMIPLAHFSQNLRQINLSYSSVTDVGLLCLASISCLQSITLLHLNGLTPSGLAAALLACGGITKVKLHECFRSLLPHSLFEHLEARGCVFHWRNKMFQAELDPKCWKLQLEDLQ